MSSLGILGAGRGASLLLAERGGSEAILAVSRVRFHNFRIWGCFSGILGVGPGASLLLAKCDGSEAGLNRKSSSRSKRSMGIAGVKWLGELCY